MAKEYGSRSKDDLLEENASLRQQIEFYEEGDEKKRNRLTALSYAVGLESPGPGRVADNIVGNARKFEAYLNGDTQADPETPVPSPS